MSLQEQLPEHAGMHEARSVVSPEMLEQNVAVTVTSDTWSLGVTAIEIAMGRVPHEGLHRTKVQSSLSFQAFSFV